MIGVFHNMPTRWENMQLCCTTLVETFSHKNMKRFQFDRGSKRKRSGINSLPLAGVWGRIVHTYSRLGLLVSGMNTLVHTHAAYLHFQPDGDISEMWGYKNGAVAGTSPRLLGRVSVQGGQTLRILSAQ